jgi:hypothetical protein
MKPLNNNKAIEKVFSSDGQSSSDNYHQDIELIDQTNLEERNNKGKKKIIHENLLEKVRSVWAEKFIPKNYDTISPDSECSDSSDSSTETIKPPKYSKSDEFDSSSSSSDNYKKYFKVTSEQSLTPVEIKTDWKNFKKDDIKQCINYVENHLPKNELEDTTYIKNLINNVKNNNVNFAQEILSDKSKYSSEELKSFNQVALETDNWINKMETEVNKFD